VCPSFVSGPVRVRKCPFEIRHEVGTGSCAFYVQRHAFNIDPAGLLARRVAIPVCPTRAGAGRCGRRRLGNRLPVDLDLEDRMIGRDAAKLLCGCVVPDTPEELAYLPFPLLEVRTQNRFFLLVRKLTRRESLTSAAEKQIALAGCAQVAHPLSVAARGHEVSGTVERERIHRVVPRPAARTASHLEDARAPDADPEPRHHCNDSVDHVAREPIRPNVSLRHGWKGTADLAQGFVRALASGVVLAARPPRADRAGCASPQS
jgi:hypothetical protein